MYYKVVQTQLSNNLSSSDSFPGEEYCLTYKVGRWTYPKTGKIFVFKNLKDAIEYTNVPASTMSIYKCEIQGRPIRLKIISSGWYTGQFELFWKTRKNKKKHKTRTFTACKGTFVVDGVKLIGRVK